MPLEVRELIIKATVTQDGSGSAASAAPTGGNNGNTAGEEQIKQTLEKDPGQSKRKK